MNHIKFQNVMKAYGKNIVINNLNFDIKEGERLILLGPSGCGKTTTLRMIAGLEEITKGNLYMGEKLVNDVPCGDRNVAMVFQNYALFPHMTVKDNISYGLKVHKLDQKIIEERVTHAIEILNLNGLENRKPKELSGGQRQRVALARALVKRSAYFLLDEPLSNLDVQLRLQARKELVKIHEMYHQTFVYVTHDQIEAMTIGNRIALMNNGDIQMLDTPSNVYNKPANVFTAKFIGSPPTNIIQAKIADGELIVSNQRVHLTEYWLRKAKENGNEEFYFGVRPEYTKITTVPQKNAFQGIVRYIEDYGNKLGVYFTIGKTDFISLCDENAPVKGSTVYFAPDFNKIYLFDCKTTKSIGI